MLKQFIVVRGAQNTGKTTAIYRLFLSLQAENQGDLEVAKRILLTKQQGGDEITSSEVIRQTLQYQGKNVWFNSSGDNGEVVQNGLPTEKEMADVDIVICASRTKGSTRCVLETTAAACSAKLLYINPSIKGDRVSSQCVNPTELKDALLRCCNHRSKENEGHLYWLVGANWNGQKLDDAFYRRGYWEMGYADADHPDYAKRRDAMQSGDRIAIKSMDGKGASTITIHAVGIIKEVCDKKVYVDWLVADLKRHVNSRGCFSTIHGPFPENDAWVCSVFCL